MTTPGPLILLIDDDEDFLEINRQILAPQGYRVVCCTDPKSAWERMAQEKPALVITDLMMNTLDSGFSLSKQIKRDPRLADVPVIIATAVTSQVGLDFRPRSPEDLAAMHVDAYFDKPIPPKQLLEKVAALLAR
jgi:chemosensory pili system protein ChpA (sensor histidine kinase/response regulator)